MKSRMIVLLVVLGLIGICASAAEPEEAKASFRYGGDLRVREEWFDDIPVVRDPPGVTRGGENNVIRIRPRVWVELDPAENVTLKVRAVEESREWFKPENEPAAQSSSYDFPDEVVFDNLYLEVRDLFDKTLDLRIGRQEMMYGNGRVILEGTPKDGSRTIYFNAAKAVFKGIEDTTIDVFGIYNPPEDEIAINSADRDLTGLAPGNPDMTESGAGVYLKNKSFSALPFEAYGIYKNEEAWNSGPATNIVAHDAAEIGTVGARLMPEFTAMLKGNLEAAMQFGTRGDQDLSGYMIDASLIVKPPCLEDMKGSIDAGVYYLSGDDPSTTDDEGWDPLWARYPQSSDLYVYAYDQEAAGYWSNVMMPNLNLCLSPLKWLKTSAKLAYLYAVEENGSGGGDERGFLWGLKGEFTLGEGLITSKDKLSGHLLVEVLEPGNYYSNDETSYFARWELLYAF